MDITTTPDATASEASLAPRSFGRTLRAYVALTKPRVLELLLVTTVPVMILAQNGLPNLWLVLATVIGGSLSAGSAAAFNMYLDRDIDAHMQRTENRPLVTGEVSPRGALVFAWTLAVFSTVWLWATTNALAAILSATAIFFYVVIYTIALKRWTAQNIVIGGAAGALPPVVAWAAATGSMSVEPILLFLIIFFWTPPHFWALALFRNDDYSRAGVPMLPVVAGPDATRLQILLYTVVLVAVAVAPWPLGYFSAVYGVTSLIFGAGMMLCAVNVYNRRTGSAALRATRKMFAFLIIYLFALFAILLLEVAVKAILPLVW